MAAAPCRWVETPAAHTNHFACLYPGALLISRGGGGLPFLQGTGREGVWPNSPTAKAEAVLVGSSTLFDALIPPKSTVPTHPWQLTNGIKELVADVI